MYVYSVWIPYKSYSAVRNTSERVDRFLVGQELCIGVFY